MFPLHHILAATCAHLGFACPLNYQLRLPALAFGCAKSVLKQKGVEKL
jgi:hypothetical protein